MRVFILLPALCLTWIGMQQASQSFAQVNIIQIVADDMGWTDLSSGNTNLGNGSPYYQTPTLDLLAQGGMSFSSAYAMPTCSPTRAALFTGQYAPLNGIHTVGGLDQGGDDTLLVGPDDGRSLKAESFTIGELLQSHGYVTAHIGKFHCTDDPDDIEILHGFTENIGGTSSGGPNGNVPYFAEQNNRGNWVFASAHGPELDPYAEPYTQAYIDSNLAPFANGNNPNVLLGTPKHLSDAMADAAIDFLNARNNDQQPFFVNVAFNAVHTEVNSRPDLETKYNGIPGSSQPQHDDPAYAGLLEGMDQAIARIVQYVDQSGLGSNTLILFISDNGGFGVTDNAPLRGSKGNFYEGGIRVPMIAYMPGTIPANSTSSEATHVVDLYKTYADLANATLPDGVPLDGESLLPILNSSQSELQRDSVFYHFPGYMGANRPMSVIIHDAFDGNRYKLFYKYEDRSFEFYDLTNDISEANDLVESGMTQTQFDVANEAYERLAIWLDEIDAAIPTERATTLAVPPPLHTPKVNFNLANSGLGSQLDGFSNGTVTQNGISMTVEAEGNQATLSSTTALGVFSNLETGSALVRRRIDGSLATPEGVLISFDQDVVIKDVDLRAVIGDGSETVNLHFVSGRNPISALIGYMNNGFTIPDSNTLAFTRTDGGTNQQELSFGQVNQTELLLTAGTQLRITADPAELGGISISSISVALPRLLAPRPTGFAVTRGLQSGGSLADLWESDNLDLSGQRSATDLQSRIEFEVEHFSAIANPSLMEFQVEAAVFARGAINQTIEMFDFENGDWVEVDSRLASRFSDSTTAAQPSGPLTRFVEPGTQRVLSRVRFQSPNPRRLFSAGVDQLIWLVN